VQLITQEALDSYLKEDRVRQWMDQLSSPGDWNRTCQKWLASSDPKRFIYQQMYGDLLDQASHGRRVLDIGGGLTCFTKVLAERHCYDLVDLCAHDDPQEAQRLNEQYDRHAIHAVDWSSFDSQNYELVIANDLFPNVDQRLEQFLQSYLPRCQRMRLSLTWYTTQRAYQVKRVDGDEIFFMLAWDGDQLHRVLNKFSTEIVDYDEQVFLTDHPSLYPNGRQVCLVDLTGRASR